MLAEVLQLFASIEECLVLANIRFLFRRFFLMPGLFMPLEGFLF
jgi:hypothetical protein